MMEGVFYVDPVSPKQQRTEAPHLHTDFGKAPASGKPIPNQAGIDLR